MKKKTLFNMLTVAFIIVFFGGQVTEVAFWLFGLPIYFGLDYWFKSSKDDNKL